MPLHESHDAGELLHQYLSGRDAPCPICKYNLRNAASDKCPECGSDISLKLASTAMPIGNWLIAILGCAMVFGFCAVMQGIQFVSSQPIVNWTNAERRIAASFLSGWVIAGIAIYFLIRTRAFFVSRRVWTQRLFALCWIAINAGILSGVIIFAARSMRG